jgi:hypothetical protein
MILQQTALDALPEPLREPIGRYAHRLRSLAGEQLLALTFYGPLDVPQPGQSSVLANAAVFRQVDLELLGRIAREGKQFGRSGIAAPWALTPELIADSRDTFPLELIEIAQQNVCVVGQDHFARLEFEAAQVRLQCERELKVIEIQLQRGLLSAAGDERSLGRLAGHLSRTLLRVLRGLAWLGGDRGPRLAYGWVEVIEATVGRPLGGVRGVLDDSLAADGQRFAAFYADVRTLREMADRLP